MRVEQSFIGAEGIGETIERRLWAAGVTHWDAFTGETVGPTRAERIRSFIDGGRSALVAGDVGYFAEAFPQGAVWRCYENFADRATAVDIETTGLDHRHSVVTTVTVHRDGTTNTLVRGDDLTPAAVRETVGGADLLLSYNGKRFDVPFLEACFDLTIDVPHLDLLYPCRRAGLTGGLSAVEDELGIDRPGPDLSGEDAVRLWHEHERGVDGALQTLIEYNRADTEHLVAIADHCTSALDPTPDAVTAE